MAVWISTTLIITLLVVLFAVVMLVKGKRTRGSMNAGRYDVFAVSGNQLTVLAGIPVTYPLEEIEEIIFSTQKSLKNSSYSGIMRVVKTNGKKSRPFLFDSSAYQKKLVFASSKQDMEQTIQYLINELQQYHIPCSHTIKED